MGQTGVLLTVIAVSGCGRDGTGKGATDECWAEGGLTQGIAGGNGGWEMAWIRALLAVGAVASKSSG
jgi:hypothetical protein